MNTDLTVEELMLIQQELERHDEYDIVKVRDRVDEIILSRHAPAAAQSVTDLDVDELILIQEELEAHAEYDVVTVRDRINQTILARLSPGREMRP